MVFGDRKQTALETAQQRERGGRSDRGRLLLAGVVGVALALSVAYLLQAAAILADRYRDSVLDSTRARLAATLAEKVERAHSLGLEALASEEVSAALVRNDAEGRMRAHKLLRQRVPGLMSTEFYAPDLRELLSVDLVRFGYTRADALAKARAQGASAPAQIQRGDDGTWHLIFAEPVRDGDRIAAYAYLKWAADELNAAIDGARVGDGKLELRQDSVVIRSNGEERARQGAPRSTPVPGTAFDIVTIAKEGFRIGDALPIVRSENLIVLFALALFFGALAARGIWLRRRMHVSQRPARVEPIFGTAPALDAVQASRQAAAKSGAGAAAAAAADAVAAGPGGEVAPAAPTPTAAVIDRSMFRAYDIRGVVGTTLTPEAARLIGQAVGTVALERGLREIVVGRDGRLSGPLMAGALIAGLRAAGCDVIDIGVAPTPVLYFATYHLNVGSGVSVTGSHNPPDYNGFKIMLGGVTLAEDAIQDLFVRIIEGRLAQGTGGVQQLDIRDAYIERIGGDIQLERKLKVVVDAGNGVAGAVAPQVLETIGCEVVPLYCEVDGNFPNHHPDPSEPKNLRDLIVAVKQMKADLGLAFDGDGDRLGVVTASGEIIYPDRVLMLFAIDVLTRAPGAPIIYDVKCTAHLQDIILRHGGSPIMWKTGHSLIKAKMREEDAELAGEMSGHFFFRERWYGFDDGIYAAARLCEILAASDRTPQEVFDELPKGVSTPELKISMEEGQHYLFIEKFRDKASFPGARVTLIDGVRADYNDGWGLVRCSNTTPSLVLRFDADSADAFTRIQDIFRKQILAIEPRLRLPF